MRCNVKPFLVCVLSVGVLCSIGCTGSTSVNINDSLTTTPDSMPIIKPSIPDTAGVITTPPVNDNNVIIPDSSH